MTAQPVALPALDGALGRPRRRVRIASLLELWQQEDIVIRTRRPDGLEEAPDLALRVRGAIGGALERREPWRARGPFDRESPHELLFRWAAPRIATPWGRTEAAVPFVPKAKLDTHGVTIVLRLFGSARIHGPELMDAALEALMGGVAIKRGGIRVPLEPVSAIRRYGDGARLFEGRPEWASGVSLSLVTPLAIRAGHRLQLDLRAVLRSAVRRAAALAPWMGVELAGEAAPVMEEIDRLRLSGSPLPENWTRYSRSAPGHAKQVWAYSGRLHAEGQLDRLLPFLTLAPQMHLGGGCAMGFGAVRTIWWP